MKRQVKGCGHVPPVLTGYFPSTGWRNRPTALVYQLNLADTWDNHQTGPSSFGGFHPQFSPAFRFRYWQVAEDEAEVPKVPTTMYSKVMPWILCLDIINRFSGARAQASSHPFLGIWVPRIFFGVRRCFLFSAFGGVWGITDRFRSANAGANHAIIYYTINNITILWIQ